MPFLGLMVEIFVFVFAFLTPPLHLPSDRLLLIHIVPLLPLPHHLPSLLLLPPPLPPPIPSLLHSNHAQRNRNKHRQPYNDSATHPPRNARLTLPSTPPIRPESPRHPCTVPCLLGVDRSLGDQYGWIFDPPPSSSSSYSSLALCPICTVAPGVGSSGRRSGLLPHAKRGPHASASAPNPVVPPCPRRHPRRRPASTILVGGRSAASSFATARVDCGTIALPLARGKRRHGVVPVQPGAVGVPAAGDLAGGCERGWEWGAGLEPVGAAADQEGGAGCWGLGGFIGRWRWWLWVGGLVGQGWMGVVLVCAVGPQGDRRRLVGFVEIVWDCEEGGLGRWQRRWRTMH